MAAGGAAHLAPPGRLRGREALAASRAAHPDRPARPRGLRRGGARRPDGGQPDGPGELGAGREAPIGVLGQRPVDRLAEGRGEAGDEVPQGGGFVRRLLHEHGRRRLGLEGAPAAEQLIGGHPQGVLVDPAVERGAHHELGGHVLGGPEHEAGAGHPRASQGSGRRHRLDDAEVAEVGVPLDVEEDVGRLDVAVDVAPAVDEVERLGDGLEPGGDRRGGLRVRPAAGASGAAIVEVAAAEVLHHREGEVLVDADVGDPHGVRVHQLDQRPDLVAESLDELGVLQHRPERDLDDHVGLQVGVAGVVDLAHPALAELVDDGVAPVRERPADQRVVGRRHRHPPHHGRHSNPHGAAAGHRRGPGDHSTRIKGGWPGGPAVVLWPPVPEAAKEIRE